MDLYNYGKYYGYPKCCIESFIESTMLFKNKTRTQIKISNNSGFIPCSYCSWKVLSKQCTLNDLIHNRICDKPFRTRQDK
jgi:hypothetical protein